METADVDRLPVINGRAFAGTAPQDDHLRGWEHHVQGRMGELLLRARDHGPLLPAGVHRGRSEQLRLQRLRHPGPHRFRDPWVRCARERRQRVHVDCGPDRLLDRRPAGAWR
jgi:hypothetical protein